MTSFSRVFATRFALGAALLASACQHDSNASFDDTGLMSPDTGGSGSLGGSDAVDVGGTDTAAGADSGGSTSGGTASGGNTSGGTKPTAGASQGGKASGGAGGKAGAGSGGGKAGTDAGGSAPQGGQTGQAGTGGSAVAGGGVGGSVSHPEPITVDTTDIDDTQVASCMPNMNFGALPTMNVDGDGQCRYEILISGPLTTVPENALVSAATLTLSCTNAGDTVTVAYANEAWKELMVRWNTRPEVGATLGTSTCEKVGKVTIDLTVAVKAWLAGTHQPYGIYLRTENSDGTDYDTSEAEDLASRPKLSVTYTLPVK